MSPTTGPFETETARLRLRRPRPGDLERYIELHTDPATYTHAPAAMPDPDVCVQRFEADLAAWATDGVGHVAAEERASGRVIGWGGLRRADGRLHLYYRLSADVLGRGFGRELARACVETATEQLPDLPLVALVKPHNHASLATATGAGLVEVARERHREDTAGDPPSVVLQAPSFTARTRLDDQTRRELIDVWCRVNDDGGAVGFRPGAPRSEVAAALAGHEAEMEQGLAVAGLLRAPDDALLGFGFWVRGAWWGHAHVLTLKRLMVDPARRRRGTGRLLMAGLHGLAARLPDVELLRLQYRSGLGVGLFYEGLGWVETGRQPLGLRLGPDDRRDDVSMARRPDGTPLAYDGRR